MVFIVFYHIPSDVFFPFLEREAYRTLREKVKDKLKGKEAEEKLILGQPETEVSLEVIQARLAKMPQVTSNYTNYDCVHGEPLQCPHAQDHSQGRYCAKCRFPILLPVNAEIIGRNGRYRIMNYRSRRGRGRLYQGIDVNTEEIVGIKEYLLPKLHFNESETRQIRKVFESQGHFNLSDGRRQDFRLPLSPESISDRHDLERCYLITRGNSSNLPTLRFHLARYGAMSASLVREVLNQILQILESLHYQKYRFTTGDVHDHLAHGNLNLDSVVIFCDRRPFFVEYPITIYLTDLALWEDLFIPPPHNPYNFDLDNDLVSLGYLAFQLLAGATVDSNGKTLNPRQERNWHTDDQDLQNYIERLLKFKQPFANVFTARQALLDLPSPASQQAIKVDRNLEQKEQKKSPWWAWLIIATLIILLLSQLIGWLVARRQVVASQNTEPVICCVSEVTAIPRGEFNYTSPRRGSWDYALTQENLILKNKSLQTQIESKLPSFFQIDYQRMNPRQNVLKSFAQGEIDFAVTSEANLSLQDNNNSDLALDTFAYDGVAVFVAFSYKSGEQGLLSSLNGQISIEQLQQLYTGQITNWQQLGGANLPVKVYMPDNPEIIKIFESKIFSNPPQRDLFRTLWQSEKHHENSTAIVNLPIEEGSQFTVLPIYQMLRTILREFEAEEIGAIGFAPISKIFGQCAVYPLAVTSSTGQTIQPLITSQNQEPIDISLDLCKAKGSYQPDIRVFQNQSYPLAFPLKVIYPRNNNLPPAGQKFAEILKTKEIQESIAKTGLIPLSIID